MARYKFTTSGDYVTFKDGDNVIATLHNTSRAIEWYYDSTGGLKWEVDGFEYQTDDIANIEFDGVACNSQDDFETGIEAMFSGYASGSGVGYPAGTKMYVALLTQSGTSAPVATVLVNTLGGTVVWSRIDSGDYRATLSGAFPTELKTHTICPSTLDGTNFLKLFWGDANYMRLVSNSDTDLLSTYYPVQILVFP